MMRTIVCYEIEGAIFVDARCDFQEIRHLNGFDKVKEIERKTCFSKKEEVKFTKECLKKYRNKQ